MVVPFLACGDLSAYDSDKTYDVRTEDGTAYVPLPPTQSPINPPYQTACYLKRNNLLSTMNPEQGNIHAEDTSKEENKLPVMDKTEEGQQTSCS